MTAVTWLNLADVVPKESEAVVTVTLSGVWGEQIQRGKDRTAVVIGVGKGG